MSHGNGGSLLSRFDTAIALVDAGFVVVAVTDTGDNYADQSRNLDVIGRSRHISRSIDHMPGSTSMVRSCHVNAIQQAFMFNSFLATIKVKSTLHCLFWIKLSTQ